MLKNPVTLAIALALATASLGLPTETAHAASKESVQAMNPFFQKSPLPFQYPQFDRINNASYGPAFEAGMKEGAADIEKIANNTAKPTFENTIVAMEKSGQVLDRVSTVFFSLIGTNNNPDMLKMQAELAPKLSAYSDAITLNGKLYARVKALYDQRDSIGLDAESKRLLERYHTDFVREGAQLNEADKTTLKDINAKLAGPQGRSRRHVRLRHRRRRRRGQSPRHGRQVRHRLAQHLRTACAGFT
jgi:peptidyl-dipeptidase Dcp